jgi:hypothetical protein
MASVIGIPAWHSAARDKRKKGNEKKALDEDLILIDRERLRP